jgi:hypothetical protein
MSVTKGIILFRMLKKDSLLLCLLKKGIILLRKRITLFCLPTKGSYCILLCLLKEGNYHLVLTAYKRH